MWKVDRAIRILPIDWHRFGRAMLFSLALFTSPYLPLGLGKAQDHGTLTVIAYFYPVLVVLWGFWKAHDVIGWSVIGIHGVNTTVFTSMVVLQEAFQISSGGFVWPEYQLENIITFPFLLTGLIHLNNFWWWTTLVCCWRWDRYLTSLVETRPDIRASTGQRLGPTSPRKQQHLLLLASVMVCVVFDGLLTTWLIRMFMVIPEADLSHTAMEADWLMWPIPRMESPQTPFHMLSVTALGLMLVLGLALRRSDIVETACWLLLPGQLLTILLLPVPLLTVVSTLVMLVLGLLVQWYHGFPLVLLQTRRGEQMAYGTDQ